MKLMNDEQAVAALLAGGVGVMPTDTLYGLVARAVDADAVNRMHALKRRERKPGTVIAANAQQLLDLGLSRRDIMAVEHLWPSPLSVVLLPQADILPHLHQGLGDFPVRVPADEKLRKLLLKTGPLATSSANLAGEAPAETVAVAERYFGDTVDFYIDGGDLSGRQPSTVARVTPQGIQIIREGAFVVPAEERVS